MTDGTRRLISCQIIIECTRTVVEARVGQIQGALEFLNEAVNSLRQLEGGLGLFCLQMKFKLNGIK